MERDNPSLDTLNSEGQAMTLASEQQAEAKKREFLSRNLWLRISTILIVVGITATIFVFRDRVEDFRTYGYLGAFLISLVTSATIILPVPGILLIAALGGVYNPVMLGLAAGAGSAIGEITGYMAGYSGQVVIKDSKTYLRLEQWMRRRGAIVIFLLAFVPNPLFDLAGATAGALRFPLWKFLLVCFLGKTPRNMLVAFAGAYALKGVLDFFERYF